MGTLLRLDDPAPRLAERLGVDLAAAERAFRAEVAYYLEHHLEGRDTGSLEDLRRRSAAVMAAAAGVDPSGAVDALMESLRFEAFPDAAPALAELRSGGLRLVVVSNWDCSLPDALSEAGLLRLVDDVVVSAAVGAAKPDPRIFEAALAAAGCEAADVVHVGDSPANDIACAETIGIRAILIDREVTIGAHPHSAAHPRESIRSLSELPALLS